MRRRSGDDGEDREMRRGLARPRLSARGAAGAAPALAEGSKFLLLASTIGPIDAGIVGDLETAFEKETGIRVRHVGAGTGATLDLARGGAFDIVMVHAKALEEKFVADGFGTKRIPVMYNDFVIVGPAEDPAGIKGMKTAAEALKTIAAKGRPLHQPRRQVRDAHRRDGPLEGGRTQAGGRLVHGLREGRDRQRADAPLHEREEGLHGHRPRDLPLAAEGDRAGGARRGRPGAC